MLSKAGLAVGAVCLVIGIVALWHAIYAERKRRKQRLTWDDVIEYARRLVRQITTAKFWPDMVLAVAGPPVIVAELMILEMGDELRPFHVLLQKHAGLTDPSGE